MITLPWRQLPPIAGDPREIRTSLTLAERDALQLLADGRVVLEVGSAFGFSTVALASVAAHVVAVDTHSPLGSLDLMRQNLEDFGLASQVTILVGSSASILAQLTAASFDLAFIDADHSFQAVQADALECLRLVKPGGVLAFHDYHESSCPDVAVALDQLFESPQTVTDTLFVARKQ